MELQVVKSQTKPLTVTIGDQTLNATYYPNALALSDLLSDTATSAAEIAPQLAKTLANWDLTDNGQPVATDAATLVTLPILLLSAVQGAIAKDLNPGE